MSADEKNMELMKTLDDAWNSQDWIEIPSKNVMQNDVAIYFGPASQI